MGWIEPWKNVTRNRVFTGRSKSHQDAFVEARGLKEKPLTNRNPDPQQENRERNKLECQELFLEKRKE